MPVIGMQSTFEENFQCSSGLWPVDWLEDSGLELWLGLECHWPWHKSDSLV